MVESWIAYILASISTLLGFVWLALAMNTHWRQVMGASALTARLGIRLRILGGFALLVSALLCFVADRPSMAILVFLMLLAAAAPSVSLLLAWRPQILRFMIVFIR